MRRTIQALAAVAVAVGVTLTTAPAGHAGTRTYGTLEFNKNPSDPSNSRLYLKIFRDDGYDVTTVVNKSYRSGSGTGSTDDCYSNNGWLPNGTYSMKMYANYPGSVIKGYAFYLPNKTCSGGTTTRTDLFIHTETGNNNVQCADAAGDQACRWEFPTYNDYRSNACIKLSPTDIKNLYDTISRFFGTSGSGGAVPFNLTVVS